jgi:SpoVK/Ycf46/Vps4 family AAA+-type ATPase
MEAWQMYFEELRSRAEPATRQQFDREALVAEAAHEAYRETADRLAREEGWDEERALVETRGLNETVRGWIADGTMDWDDLRRRLQQRS